VKKSFLIFVIVGLAAVAWAVAPPEAELFKDLSIKDPAYPYVVQLVSSYEVMAGYPDGTFRGEKTITRAEFSKVLVKTVGYLENKYHLQLAVPTSIEATFKDLPKEHWAYPVVNNLVQYKIIAGYPDGTFRPTKTLTQGELAILLKKTWGLVQTTGNSTETLSFIDPRIEPKSKASRFTAAIAVAKFIVSAEAVLALRITVKPVSSSNVAKAVEISPQPQTSVSGAFGNVYEGASGTNNWRNFNLVLTYDAPFKVGSFTGNCEVTGKYWLDQIHYLVSSGGSLVDENRLEFEVNTINPVVDFKGINGKLLLGVKYLSLSNRVAPSTFLGFNAGLVTTIKAYGRNILLRGFWSLPIVRAQVSPSILGQPAQLFDYEVSVDHQLFSYPVLLGLSGELMTFTNYGQRWYNLAFVRYYLF
jgi:hypothetical protein